MILHLKNDAVVGVFTQSDECLDIFENLATWICTTLLSTTTWLKKILYYLRSTVELLKYISDFGSEIQYNA